MKLIPEADRAHRLWSVQSMAATVLLIVAESLPLWESVLPENTFLALSAITGTLSIALRLVTQHDL